MFGGKFIGIELLIAGFAQPFSKKFQILAIVALSVGREAFFNLTIIKEGENMLPERSAL